MFHRRHILTILGLTGVGVWVSAHRAWAQAAPAGSAKAFLESIYRVYLRKDGSGIDIIGRAKLARYFVPDLVDIIHKDRQAADKNGEVPTLEADPFISAQDWQVSNLKVEATEAPDDTGTGVVTFRNLGENRRVRLKLRKLPAGWRIDDIDWGGDLGTLRGLFKPQ